MNSLKENKTETIRTLKAEIAELKHTVAEMELYIHSLEPTYLGTRRQFQR